MAASDQVIDIFEAAGLKKPDISILSDEFLSEVRGLPQKNVALELLRKLLSDELKVRSRRNLVQSRAFSELLERALRSYRNRAIETAQVIDELIKLAREMREAQARGENLGLSEDELAFYDALGVNDAAVRVMGDSVLRAIARELTDTIRRNVTLDWTQREAAQAKLRTMVRRMLRKHGYPPDKQEQATKTVMEQAERLCETWADDGLIGTAPAEEPVRGAASVVPLRPSHPAPRDYDADESPLPLAADTEMRAPQTPTQEPKKAGSASPKPRRPKGKG